MDYTIHTARREVRRPDELSFQPLVALVSCSASNINMDITLRHFSTNPFHSKNLLIVVVTMILEDGTLKVLNILQHLRHTIWYRGRSQGSAFRCGAHRAHRPPHPSCSQIVDFCRVKN